MSYEKNQEESQNLQPTTYVRKRKDALIGDKGKQHEEDAKEIYAELLKQQNGQESQPNN